jgi:hypothetical protein
MSETLTGRRSKPLTVSPSVTPICPHASCDIGLSARATKGLLGYEEKGTWWEETLNTPEQ